MPVNDAVAVLFDTARWALHLNALVEVLGSMIPVILDLIIPPFVPQYFQLGTPKRLATGQPLQAVDTEVITPVVTPIGGLWSESAEDGLETAALAQRLHRVEIRGIPRPQDVCAPGGSVSHEFWYPELGEHGNGQKLLARHGKSETVDRPCMAKYLQ